MSEKQRLKQDIRTAIEADPVFGDIQRVSLFGSYAYGTPTEESDIDLLVEFIPDNSVGMFKFLDMKHAFEDRLHKKVDLVTPDALSKYFRDEVLEKSEPIYDRA